MAQNVINNFMSCMSYMSCMGCFPRPTTLKINRFNFKILRLLGEGGFSYVYLIQDTSNEALYALKKIRCLFGQESVLLAMKEVEAYSLFSPHPNIIQCIDYAILSEGSDPGTKTVYIVLPYFRRGNLQDTINANLVNHTEFPEKKLMIIFLGVCRALKAMHQHRSRGTRDKKDKQDTGGLNHSGTHTVEGTIINKAKKEGANKSTDSDSDSEQQKLLTEEEPTLDQEEANLGGLNAYAHRDIKPGNIMIDDDGERPILMDLGSVAPSPITITSRSQALALQDTAAEHSTMPYRAPELFDVRTGSIIDTKVDIWSLGCTLYACLVGKSPFEMRSDETGGSLSICILSGDWRFPDEGAGGKKTQTKAPEIPAIDTSSGIRNIVRKCLKVEPTERPDIDDLISIVEDIISRFDEDGSL
ncbi:Serine/threonine-protein kinase ppk13 [Golovinomyces cichoracearum]|uniref:non-specific serine/threonine protein kinase n=1 Tax=Golovinomyces cichoracearum TaxID=62708 RepID=A0A420I6B6_9PEZI|nr:Serine/threonine-protein kinase ppk13 [Golovinomyces cichoracearum]